MKIKEIILYIIFGTLTTIINFLSFYLFLEITGKYTIATSIAYLISIIFAFITNKTHVFKNNSNSKKEVFKQLYKFIICRGFTYLLDLLGMIFLIEIMLVGEINSKILINILVIAINYIFSKLFIFKDEDKNLLKL